MAYTNVAKPTGTSYSNVAKPTTSYTNITKPNSTSYTNLAKPTISNGTATLRRGRAIGLLIPLTVSLPAMTTLATYTNITKPSGTSYTNVNKPT